MQKIVEEKLTSVGQKNILDTLPCRILDRDYSAFAFKQKRKIYCILLANKENRQDTFVAELTKNSDYRQIVDYMEKYLHR